MLPWNRSRWKPQGQLKLDDKQIKKIFADLELDPKFDAIDLSRHIFTKTPNFEHFIHIREIILHGNQIKRICTKNFPPSVEFIDLDNCSICTVQNFNHLLHLRRLYLKYNCIKTLKGLPGCIEEIHLDDNPLEVLSTACFPNERVHKLLISELSDKQAQHLLFPVKETLVNYELLKTNRDVPVKAETPLFIFGPPNSGKSRIIQNLTGGNSLHCWKLNDLQLYHIFEERLEDNKLLHNFLSFCPGAVVIITYDISTHSDENFKVFGSNLSSILEKQPQERPYVVLTYIEELNPWESQRQKLKFRQRLEKFINVEITQLNSQYSKNKDDELLSYLIKSYQQLQSSIPEFVFTPMHIKEKLIQLSQDNQQHLPHECYDVFTKLCSKEKLVWAVEELTNEFKGCSINSAVCMQFLSKIGYIFWARDHRDLKDCVFHKTNLIISILRDVMAKNLGEAIAQVQIEESISEYSSEGNKNFLKTHRHDGIINRNLLNLLWRKHSLQSHEKTALLNVMKYCQLCCDVSFSDDDGEDTINSELLHCLWFRKTQPSHVNLTEPMQVNETRFTLMMHCDMHGKVPTEAFQKFCQSLLKYAVKNYRNGEREIWSTGILVSFDRVDCIVYTLQTNTTIYCRITSPITDIVQSWKSLTLIYKEVKHFFVQNIIKEIYLKCAHCAFKGRTGKDQHSWIDNMVWKDTNREKYVRCLKEPGEHIPAILVLAWNQGDTDVESACREARQYLQNRKAVTTEMGLTDDQKRCLLGHRERVISTMYSPPVIEYLQIRDKLGNSHKELNRNWRNWNASRQAEFIFNDVLLKGDKTTLKAFCDALEASGYHTNLTIAQMIPIENSNHRVLLAVMLTKDEKKQIKEHFSEKFKNLDEVRELTDVLYQMNCLQDYQNEYINQSCKTRSAIIDYLLHDILLRGTYETIEYFKKGLWQIRQGHLASLLPMRGRVSLHELISNTKKPVRFHSY